MVRIGALTRQTVRASCCDVVATGRLTACATVQIWGVPRCEDVLAGLEAAVNLDWRGHVRLLFLLAQTPNHGPRFHDKARGAGHQEGLVRIFSWDDHFDVDTGKADRVLLTLVQKDIHFHCLEISGSTSKMFEAFQEVYNNKDEGRVMKVHTMTSDAESLLSTIVKASWSSVQETFTRTSASWSVVTGQEQHLPEFNVSKVSLDPNIDWENMTGWQKFQARLESVEVQDELCTKFRTHETRTTVHIAPKPFSHGAMRAAWALYDESINAKLVAKRYMRQDSRYNAIEVLEGDLRSQALAMSLAEKFNRRRPNEPPLHFVQLQLMRIDVMGKEKLMTVEPFIPGEYRKETNNASFVREGSDIAQAFSHFSHDVTGGACMVVDIQGVRESLTDPQIHSKHSCFGRGNLGTKGFDAFFMVHQCNEVCRHLKLKPNPMQLSSLAHDLIGSLEACPWKLGAISGRPITRQRHRKACLTVRRGGPRHWFSHQALESIEASEKAIIQKVRAAEGHALGHVGMTTSSKR